MKKRENFPQNKLVDFFRGGRVQGDVCGGGLLGNKRPDRGKKNFRGARNFRGGLFGEMPKKGWKNFLVVPIFLGVTTIFWGGKFLNFRGECWEIKDKIGEKNFRGPEILGGNFWGKCKKRVEKLCWGSVGGAVNPNKF